MYLEIAKIERKNLFNPNNGYLLKALEIAKDEGKNKEIFKIYKELILLYKEKGYMEEELTTYKEAITYLEDDAESIIIECYLRMAEISIKLEKYKDAIYYYDQAIEKRIHHLCGEFIINSYIFDSLLVAFVVDEEEGKKKLKEYNEKYPSFIRTRQGELCEKLVECIENKDLNTFVSLINKYDQISRLKDFETTCLLIIRKRIEENDIT